MEKNIRSEFISRLKNLSSCVISDAMDLLGLKSVMNSSIKPIKSGTKLAGPAITFRRIKKEKISGGNFSQYTNVLHETIDSSEPNDIFVVDADGDTESSSWGGNMSIAAKTRNLGGVIIDGAARDKEEIANISFPLFCKSIIPTRSRGRLLTVEYNVPVICGDIFVHPGDFIMGDDDGVVVLPKNCIDEILTLAEEIEQSERKIQEYLKEGHTLIEAMQKYKLIR